MRRLTAAVLTLATASLAVAGQANAQAHDAKAPAITEYLPDYQLPELWFGAKAPELRIDEFVKGKPVTSFEPGRVYVVEFWATWCGPCIRAFPHLSELQANHADKMTIIGVNIWDTKRGESQDARVKRVADFVEEQGERMAYTVAVEDGTKMAESWMEKAGRNGIPSAFIVDQEGRIAWMGHPAAMDEPLLKVLEGKYDAKDAAEEAAKAHELEAWADLAMTRIVENQPGAYELADKLIPTVFADNPQLLNAMAWMILTEDGIENRNYKTAEKAARLACEKTEWNDPGILDTMALAVFRNGDAAEAVRIQKMAMEKIKGTPWEENSQEFEERLAEFEAALDQN